MLTSPLLKKRGEAFLTIIKLLKYVKSLEDTYISRDSKFIDSQQSRMIVTNTSTFSYLLLLNLLLSDGILLALNLQLPLLVQLLLLFKLLLLQLKQD